jgi:cytochrome b involved in lipid metabolism
MNRFRLAVLLSSVAVAATSTLVGPATASAETTYRFAEVQKHSTSSDCWAIVNGGVYNLTSFIGRHEGGPAPIKAMCGLDGTVSYSKQHPARSGENEPASALAHYRIGVLDPASVPAASTTTFTLATIGKHNTATDCWSAVGGGVYDLTKWIGKHPGGQAVITMMCGADGTTMYQGKHKGSTSAGAALAQFKVGTIGTTGTTQSTTQTTTKTYTLKQVRKHNSSTNCWSVVNRKVYNLTKWIPKHPGGKSTIIGMCGKKASKAFTAQHGGSASAKAALKQYKIGRLA